MLLIADVLHTNGWPFVEVFYIFGDDGVGGRKECLEKSVLLE